MIVIAVGIVYLLVGYYLFWDALKRPRNDHGVLMPLLAFVIGPPIFVIMYGRAFMSGHRPGRHVFVDIAPNEYRVDWMTEKETNAL